MDANQLRFNQMCAAMLDQFDDDDWDTIIVGEIDAMPEQVQDWGDWFTLGELDGEDGATCDPLLYGYPKVVDCESYILGWKGAMSARKGDK